MAALNPYQVAKHSPANWGVILEGVRRKSILIKILTTTHPQRNIGSMKIEIRAWNKDSRKLLKQVKSGAYAIFHNDKCLYVGSSSNLLTRLRTYFVTYSGARNLRLASYLLGIRNEIHAIIKPCRISDLLEMERDLFDSMKPIFNKAMPNSMIEGEKNEANMS